MVIIGALSDLEILKSPTKRIIFQTLILSIFLFISEIFIESVRIEFIDSFLEIYQFKLIFTIFCLLILINGTNFLDGLNTLVTVYYIMVILCILYLKHQFNFNFETTVLEVTLLALIVFLFFNFFGKAYLGDNGSYLISFILGIFLIEFSNKGLFDEETSRNLSPYFVACLLWYPAYENLFSIIRKKVKKISPAEADNKHLHQLIFIQLKRKLKFDNKILNTLSGVIINIYNLFVFLISVNNFTNTKILIIILGINILTYTTLYFALKKGA
jgi:UDP-N-acetylmuramyl pentapeptide phosphotransferase/UDP-N-acetylglucosamine-1-phosphate transferase